ncbi:uncharacterized protein QC763_507210 [Podospora pseudopauciseta]|uniref:FAD-binding domain-containing protein n=2 Tax=Podospora TaxID=5144 RepID=A0ABR0H9W5_9PEZI|nr:hypothetical protein QC763_507210 [Podospora pseudopauciseta]KAK4675826.1 hypothetical protein QC764_507210 [Podospora pseudoanserina]
MATSQDRVLIVGAGSSGLLIAQVLKKAGIPATVFEQDTSPTSRHRDWNFGIYWAQSRLEECLPPNLHDLVKSTQTDPNYEPSVDEKLNIFNGHTGEMMNSLPAPYSMRIRRRPWLELLKTGIDVRYGKRLSSVSVTDISMTIAFEDGTSETGTLLIGAEGAHSPTREFLFRRSPHEAALLSCPIVTTATLTTFPKEIAGELAKLHLKHIITFDPAGMIVWIGVVHNRTPTDCTYMILVSWESQEETGLREAGSDAILADLKCRAEKLASPFKDAIQSVPNGTRAWHARLSYWPTKPWDNHNGKVTLAGDAAHPMTFHRGQGLGNAITDAAEFQTCLSSSSNNLVEAVAKYEKEMWARGFEAVKVNLENSIALHDWKKVLLSPFYKAGIKRDAEVGVSEEGKVDEKGQAKGGEGGLFDE